MVVSLLKKIVSPLLFALRKLGGWLAYKQDSLYHLEEIDVSNGIVCLRCRGTRTVIKISIASLVGDSALLRGMTPKQASLVGGYYGRMMRAALEGRGAAVRKAKNMTFLLKDSVGQYKIVYQNRDGKVGYINKRNRREFLEQPLTIVRTLHIISKFDPSQACYLGILAGISVEKAISDDQKTGGNQLDALLNKRPQLRVVSDD